MRVCNTCRETIFGNPDVCPKCHRSLATIKEEKNVECAIKRGWTVREEQFLLAFDK